MTRLLRSAPIHKAMRSSASLCALCAFAKILPQSHGGYREPQRVPLGQFQVYFLIRFPRILKISLIEFFGIRIAEDNSVKIFAERDGVNFTKTWALRPTLCISPRFISTVAKAHLEF
jgi:hypothetical protein